MKKSWKAAAIGFIILLLLLICFRDHLWDFYETQSKNIFQEFVTILWRNHG